MSGASKVFKLSKSNSDEPAVFKGKAVPAQVYYAAMPFDALDSFSPSDPSLAYMELPCLQIASVNSIPAQARLAVSSASDIFSANTFTAIVTNYPNEPDLDVMRQLALWYEAYNDSGFDVIYIGSQSTIRDYSTYPWHISSSTPGTYWSYVQSYATTTITLVDKDGYMVADSFSAPDGVLDILEDEFGSLEDNMPQTPERTVKVIQKASKGDGIDLVFLGDTFTSKMISGGLFDQAVNDAVEAFFSTAPVSGFRDRFNIYSIAVPSISSDYFDGLNTASVAGMEMALL